MQLKISEKRLGLHNELNKLKQFFIINLVILTIQHTFYLLKTNQTKL